MRAAAAPRGLSAAGAGDGAEASTDAAGSAGRVSVVCAAHRAEPWPWATQRTLTPAANATGCAPAGLAPGLCLRTPRAPAPQAAAPRRARPGRRMVQVRGAPTSPPPTPPLPAPESGSQGVRCDLPRGCGLAGEMRAPWPCLSDQRVHRGLAPNGRAGGRGPREDRRGRWHAAATAQDSDSSGAPKARGGGRLSPRGERALPAPRSVHPA